MLEKIKSFFQPCAEELRSLKHRQREAMKRNEQEVRRLTTACEGGHLCAINNRVIPKAFFDERHLNDLRKK